MVRLLILSILLSCADRAAGTAEVAVPSRNSAVPAPIYLGTNMVGTSAAELSCLFSQAAPEAKPADVKKTAEGIETALKYLKMPSDEFTRTSLLHFMSQTLYETGDLKSVEQKGAPSEEKKGYGCVQVTGSSNLKEASECMNEAKPPDGSRMMANKSATIGNEAPDRTAAALVSLCWWKKNVVQNRKHQPYSLEASTEASQAITSIVNAGGPNRRVTGGKQSLDKRAQYFQNLAAADSGGTCRKL